MLTQQTGGAGVCDRGAHRGPHTQTNMDTTTDITQQHQNTAHLKCTTKRRVSNVEYIKEGGEEVSLPCEEPLDEEGVSDACDDEVVYLTEHVGSSPGQDRLSTQNSRGQDRLSTGDGGGQDRLSTQDRGAQKPGYRNLRQTINRYVMALHHTENSHNANNTYQAFICYLLIYFRCCTTATW